MLWWVTKYLAVVPIVSVDCFLSLWPQYVSVSASLHFQMRNPFDKEDKLFTLEIPGRGGQEAPVRWI